MKGETKIILFDGVCNLCNGVVQFIIKRDREQKFRFAPLQGKTGKKLLAEFGIDPADTDSIVLVDGDSHYVKSAAALRIAKDLNGIYPLLYSFIAVPGFLRDGVYDIVAKYRYRWFGKKESCMIPTIDLQSRFLE